MFMKEMTAKTLTAKPIQRSTRRLLAVNVSVIPRLTNQRLNLIAGTEITSNVPKRELSQEMTESMSRNANQRAGTMKEKRSEIFTG